MTLVTAQVESYRDVIDEVKLLFPFHWQELGIYKDKMPLDPEYSEYERLDQLGSLVFITLRSDGAVVGYFVGAVTRGLHYQSTVQCKMDVAYVLPEHRGGSGKLLFDTVKQELVRRGVQIWWVGSKDHHPIEKFYETLGFERQETYFAQWIGQE